MIDPITGVEVQEPAAPASGPAAPAPAATTPPPEGKQGSSTPDGKQGVPLAALQDERQKRQESEAQLSTLQQEIAGLKEMIGQQQTQYTQPQAPVAPQPQPVNPTDSAWNNEEAWQKDPKGAVRNSVQAEILAALQWYDSQSVTIAGQEATVMGKYTDYAQYKTRVDQQLRKIPFSQRTQPGVVEAAYFMAKGQNADQLLTAQQQDLIARIRRGEAVQGLNPGITGAPVVPNAPAQLTEDQLKAAAMMNLSPDQYASSIVRK